MATARADHPSWSFEVAAGHRFEVASSVDAALSDTALHWMLQPDEVIRMASEPSRPTLEREGRWHADYVRLRFVAERIP